MTYVICMKEPLFVEPNSVCSEFTSLKIFLIIKISKLRYILHTEKEFLK